MVNYKNYSLEENEYLFGPGKRLLLFCQGCSIHCKGCINQHLWEFGKGEDISSSEILSLAKDCEGITLHGGEPLDQSEGILDIIKLFKQNNKTAILFTGYKYKELKYKSQKEAWKLADIVVSGRYIEEKRNIYLQFRGSTNQKVYCHDGPYKDYKIKDGKSVAIFRLKNGVLTSRGFRNDELSDLLNEIKKVRK